MIMMWIWFVIGITVAIAGVIARSSEENITFKQWNFNAEELGYGLIWLGGATSVVMVIGILLVTGLKILS